MPPASSRPFNVCFLCRAPGQAKAKLNATGEPPDSSKPARPLFPFQGTRTRQSEGKVQETDRKRTAKEETKKRLSFRCRAPGQAKMQENATKLGLKGIPNLAEELQISRDLFLLEYTEGKLHIPTISTAKSVQLIKNAKAKGLDVSCSVSVLNLIYNDNSITEFERLMVADAQTSGGLLISLPKDKAAQFLDYYNSRSSISAFQIGSVNHQGESLITVS